MGCSSITEWLQDEIPNPIKSVSKNFFMIVLI